MRKTLATLAFLFACVVSEQNSMSANRILIAEYAPWGPNSSFYRIKPGPKAHYDRILRRVILLSGNSELAGTAISIFSEQGVNVEVYCGAGDEHCSIYFPGELLKTVTDDEFEAAITHECWHVIGTENQWDADKFAIALLKKDAVDPYSLLSFLEKASKLLPLEPEDRQRLKCWRRLFAKSRQTKAATGGG